MTRILIIEDDAALRAMATEMLAEEGYQVVAAPDGATGLTMAYESPPALVLCDLQLGDISGYEVLAGLRRNATTALIPVIFVTGMGSPIDVRQGMDLGADDYLVKPVGRETLLTSVRARLTRSQAVGYEAAARLTELRHELARSLLPHELLTPLTAVMGLASLLKEEGAIEPGQVKEVAEGILAAGDELKVMITKFLLYAEILTTVAGTATDPGRAAVALAEAAREEAVRAGRESDLEIDVVPFRSPMSIEHLQALTHELVQNALRFSAAGSAVTVRSRQDGDRCVLSVTDRGTGMTTERIAGLERAPFLRRNQDQPGIGLGLTIVRKLTAMYGGQLAFETAADRGTIASLLFVNGTEVDLRHAS